LSANVKEYATIVKIDGQQEGIKPGMTAEVEILVEHLKGVLALPVAAVVEQRGKFFCWVKQGGKLERRPLVLGMSNDEFIEVKDGVEAGDEVILNPRAVVPSAREESDDEDDDSVEKKFGSASPGEQRTSGRDGGGRPRQGRGPGQQGPGTGPAGASPGRAGPSQPGPAAGGRAGPPRGGGRAPNPADWLKGLDTDGDGKVSRDEARGPMRDGFDKIDGNGDGFIDAAELRALMKQFPQGGGRPGGGSPGNRPSAGGPPAEGRP
jgi:hypothetical protein